MAAEISISSPIVSVPFKQIKNQSPESQQQQQLHQVEQGRTENEGGPERNRRKYCLVGLVIFLLLTILSLSISLPFLLLRKNHHHHNHDEDFTVSGACKTTRYPDVCYASLASSQTPGEMLQDATRAAIGGIQEMLNLTIRSKRGDRNSIKVQAAFEDCVDLLGSSIEELQSSLHEFEKGDYEPEIADIQTWMSAALTYQDTCMDELEEVTSESEKSIGPIRKAGQRAQKLLSNALALVNPLVAEWRASVAAGQQKHWSAGVDHGLVNGAHVVDAVVAKDGSGHFATIQDALHAAPRMSQRRYVIHIRAGVYNEYVEVKMYHTNIMFVGDGQGRTIITGNKNVKQPGVTTISSSTVSIEGKNFMARELTIENTAGPNGGQAVALKVRADQAAFYRCSILGYQDTLLAHVFRQFYRECTVSGTVDFVFGNAAAVFQNCTFLSRVPLHGQQTVVTAQARTDPAQNTGFSFHMCRVGGEFPVYLGRPWKEYARVVWLRSEFDSVVQPQGWLEWQGSYGLGTSYFAEYKNSGPGSGLRNRVKWAKVISKSRIALKFTPTNFISARKWLPRASVISDSKL